MNTHAIPPLPIHFTQEKRLGASRNGKIARLPRATRDMINHMLDDGLPYHIIIDELGEAGEHLNLQNLTNWKQGAAPPPTAISTQIKINQGAKQFQRRGNRQN